MRVVVEYFYVTSRLTISKFFKVKELTMTRVHIGCGDQVGKSWLNFDMSPILYLDRLPGGGYMKRAIGGSDYVFPSEVKIGNISKGPLVPIGTATACYASHVLEHLTLEDAHLAIKNIYQMLATGGVFRLIVPDLEWRSRLYLENLNQGDAQAASNFLRSSILGQETKRGLIRTIRSAFSGSSHLWMWDYVSMKGALEHAGFKMVRRTEFGDASDSAFSEVENEARFWSAPPGKKNLYRELSMECVRLT